MSIITTSQVLRFAADQYEKMAKRIREQDQEIKELRKALTERVVDHDGQAVRLYDHNGVEVVVDKDGNFVPLGA